jgi:hypothetical protein
MCLGPLWASCSSLWFEDGTSHFGQNIIVYAFTPLWWLTTHRIFEIRCLVCRSWQRHCNRRYACILLVNTCWSSSMILSNNISLSSLQFPLSGTIGANTIQQWWGNRVYKETADWQYVPLKTVSSGTTFGCVPRLANSAAYTDGLAYTRPSVW